MSLTNDEITAKNFKEFYRKILPYLVRGNNGYSETPIGAMQMFDDNAAPSGWLIADGTVYNISDYPFLASHIERVHGSKNYYGGDGTTTFAVPNWQGEFFRASGTNAHANQGSGAGVGEHQDATEHTSIWLGNSSNELALYKKSNNVTNYKNQDSYIQDNDGYQSVLNTNRSTDVTSNRSYTSRPTNTSLLCCIKAVPAGVNYSTEEQEIGTWIDGKPLYQKTYEFNSPVNLTAGDWGATSIPIGNIDKIIHVVGYSNSTTSWEGLSATADIGSYVNLIFFRAIAVYKVTLQYTKTTD